MLIERILGTRYGRLEEYARHLESVIERQGETVDDLLDEQTQLLALVRERLEMDEEQEHAGSYRDPQYHEDLADRQDDLDARMREAVGMAPPPWVASAWATDEDAGGEEGVGGG